MNIQVREYDLTKPIGMMPGMAIKEIMENVGGKLISAGIVTNDPGCLKDDGRAVYYLKMTRDNGRTFAESLWVDDGIETCCYYYNLNGAGWKRTIISQDN